MAATCIAVMMICTASWAMSFLRILSVPTTVLRSVGHQVTTCTAIVLLH